MMKYLIPAFALFLFAGLSLSTASCKKKNLSSKGNLLFSVDTLVFDTVFTTIGSTTGQFKVYNPDHKKLTIEEIELVGGSSSPFRINFDGLQGTKFTDIDLPGKDSLFCFVEVTLNVNGANLPMVIEDSIRFRTNGVDQYVKLAVWGQDAYFHYYDVNSGTWPNDKPHVVYGYAGVDEGQTLNIPAGTHVYLHKNSAIYVFRSTLNVNGTASNKVTFQGDRLESFYDNVAGQYYGIYFDSAQPSTINHAQIKNATTGIHVESKYPATAAQPTVTVTNTEIWNNASYGMLLYDHPKLIAENTLIHGNAVHALIVLQGADMTFTHCDLLGYGGGDGTTPAVGMRNYFVQDGTETVTDITGTFNNCVIYGAGTEELVMDTVQPGGVNINFLYRNCLLRMTASTNAMFSSCLFNLDPQFHDRYNNDFTTTSGPMQNSGTPLFTLPTDLLGLTRNQLTPDIGVYEF